MLIGLLARYSILMADSRWSDGASCISPSSVSLVTGTRGAEAASRNGFRARLDADCAATGGAGEEDLSSNGEVTQTSLRSGRNAHGPREKMERTPGKCADALPSVIHLYFFNQKPARVSPQEMMSSGLVAVECESARTRSLMSLLSLWPIPKRK